MNYIEYKEGTVYDPAHLRPFNLELAKQGHPLATIGGAEVRCFRAMSTLEEKKGFRTSDFWMADSWDVATSHWFSCGNFDLNRLRLAPLDVKDGRALHVGDVIEARNNHYDRTQLRDYERIKITDDNMRIVNSKMWDWRWPVEVNK